MFDLSPLYKSTVGFDRLFSLLDSAANMDRSAPSYPPYNIERLGDNEYRITMAVAGFRDEELAIEVKENVLSVVGRHEQDADREARLLHRGIASRGFERRFQLADFVEVSGASLVNGLLHIDLKREIPEAMKPRSIKIAAGSAAKQIEGTKAA